MAKFVIAGVQDCPYYVRAEMLGDKLAVNLVDFKIHKVVLTNTQWPDWLKGVCEKYGWEHHKSPIVWRELVDRGGKGVLIGGSNEFEEYAYGYYGVTIDMDHKSMGIIAEENKETKTITDEEEKMYKESIKFCKLCITNASDPIVPYLVPSLLSGKIFGEQLIKLCLLYIDETEKETLEQLAEDIHIMAYDLLCSDVIITCDCEEAFKGSRVVIFLDEVKIQEDEKRLRWVERNAVLFESYGKSLSKVISRNSLMVVAGNNYISCNIRILHEMMPEMSTKNIIGIPGVYENEAKSLLAAKLDAPSGSIDNVIVWGNINTAYCINTSRALVRGLDCSIVGPSCFTVPMNDVFVQEEWLQTEFLEEARLRNSLTEQYMGHPTYHLQVHSIETTLYNLWNGASGNNIFSLVIISEGWYDVPVGIAFSFPVTFCLPLSIAVIEDMDIPGVHIEEMKATIEVR
ncbi:putative malate dehydrogenase 1B, partial [Argonauta hians]